MFTCRICHFATELDDVAVRGPADRSICLRCYSRETDTGRPMPKPLRQAISAALAECCPA